MMWGFSEVLTGREAIHKEDGRERGDVWLP